MQGRKTLPGLGRRRLGNTCCVVGPTAEVDELFWRCDNHVDGYGVRAGGGAGTNAC
jgi:hypothetical protein